jgi:excisionase family DNA binding protein
MASVDTPDMPMLLTLDECASVLRVSTRTVRRMIKRRELVAFRLGDGPNRQLRIVEKSLLIFISQRLKAG